MAFTNSDCLKEVLLKLMVAMAWEGSAVPQERREVIDRWISHLLIEGPEMERIYNLLNCPVDQFQKNILQNELKTLLVFEEERQQLTAILESILSCNRFPGNFENGLIQLVQSLMVDHSQLSLMICKQSLDSFNPSLLSGS